MKAFYTIILAGLVGTTSLAQVEEQTKGEDTTTMNIGNKEIIIIDKGDVFYVEDGDTIYPETKKKKKSEAHWAGVDFGVHMLMNNNFDNNFANDPHWNTDVAKSFVWNLNLLEHKFNFGTPYVGLTVGGGLNFTSIAFKDNYLLSETPDALVAEVDTINTYRKNKLKALYLTVPLLLEFNTNAKSNKSFYLAAGAVGGLRMPTPRIKRKGEFDGKEFVQKDKGNYGLNPFKLEGMVRLGYNDFGVFASYNFLPLFDTNKTVEIYPLSFGLSLNF